MKKIIMFFLIIIVNFSLMARTDYREIIKTFEQAKLFGKNIVIIFNAEWCEWCKKMERETFSDPEVKKALKDYLILRLDYDNNKIMRKKYGLNGVPCTIFINSNLQEIDRIIGYLPPEKFLKEIKRIKEGKDTFLYLSQFESDDCKDANIHHKLAIAYFNRTQYKKTIEQCNLAKKYGYNPSDIEWLLGTIYKELGDFDNAIKHLKISIKLGGNILPKYRTLMLCYYYDREYGKTIYIANKLINLYDPDEHKINPIPMSLFIKGLCFKKMGLKKDANRNLKLLVEKYPDNYYTNMAKRLIKKLVKK